MKEVPPSFAAGRDYPSWTLFLVCEQWATPAMSTELAALYRLFRPFGDKIGVNNLAVWFWRQETPVDHPRLAEDVDVARSARYCQEPKLRPSEGPFLVITTSYPDLAAFPTERAVVTLGGLPPNQGQAGDPVGVGWTWRSAAADAFLSAPADESPMTSALAFLGSLVVPVGLSIVTWTWLGGKER